MPAATPPPATDGNAAAPPRPRPADAAFRAMAEHGADVVALVDAGGTVVYVNRAAERVLGRPSERLVGRQALDLVPAEDRERVRAALAEVALRPGATVAVEHGYDHPDGSPRWLVSTATNLLDLPAVGAILCNVHDVTERAPADDARNRLAAAAESSEDPTVGRPLPGTTPTSHRGAQPRTGVAHA